MSLRIITVLALAAACGACSDPPPPMNPEPATPWPDVDEGFIAQVAATYGFRLGHPQEITIAPDGDILFTRTEPRGFVADLYRRDGKTGEVAQMLDAETLLGGSDETLSAEEKARRERMRKATRGIGGYQLSDDGARLLVPLSDRLFTIERAGGAARELETGEGFPYDPRLSPAGDKVAYVVDGDLWVAPIGGGKPKRLTTRASDTVEHGVAEFVAQEEMGRTRGYWWSPDGASIAYQKNDVSGVDVLFVSDPAHPDRAPTPFRYPRAGRPDAVVTLGVIPAGGGTTTWIEWDRAKYPYLCRVVWNDKAPLTLVVMNETQTELAVLAADAKKGATRVLLTETDPAWLNLPRADLPQWLEDGSGFLWMTERRGEWQLELRGADGAEQRALTEQGFGLQGYEGYDGEARTVWVTASTDPTQTHVFTVPLDGPARQVTAEEGVHDVTIAKKGGGVVVTSLPKAGGTRFEARARDGTFLGELPSVAEQPPFQAGVEWTTAEVSGRTHHAAIIRPRKFDKTRRYPVLVHVYAGPHARMVSATPRPFLLDQWYADAGFVVVAIDGRGTPNRGRDWERAVHKDLITIPLADQVDVLKALGATYPELDLDRVGIYGWSFGGYASAMAVLLRPDVFRAAVAGAPVTDWALYDTFYTERYMMTPETNPEGYVSTSALTHAAKLERPLLVIHGTTDDNVHFAHSLTFVEALFRAGRRFELLPVSATHMTPDPEIALSLHRRQLSFFRENL